MSPVAGHADARNLPYRLWQLSPTLRATASDVQRRAVTTDSFDLPSNNQYGNYLLYYNNTVSDAKWSYRSTWPAAQAKDLYGCQLLNNVGTSGMNADGEGLLTSHNTWQFDGLRDPHRIYCPHRRGDALSSRHF